MLKNRATSPSFIVRQPHSYCCRLVVPPHLRSSLGRTELRYTLHTGSLSTAKSRSHTIAAFVLELFRKLEASRPSSVLPHTPEQLQGLIRDFVADCLTRWEVHIPSKPVSAELWQSTLERLQRNKDKVPDLSPPPADAAPEAFPDALAKNLLTKVIAEYATEKKNAGKWTHKTEQENYACYQLFLAWAGQDIMVEDINAKLMREYKATLQKLPANREKNPKYRDKGIHELAAMADRGGIPKPMGITTINKNLNRISTLLAYAKKDGYISTNPAEDMQLEQPKLDEELRGTFSHDDLHALFHSPQYTRDTFKHPYQFWTPLLALFTGARQTELAQLYLEDIRQENEVWVFDINKKLDKQLKSKNAARLIPVHPFLIELGLLRYAQELKDKGKARLFPELTIRRDGYGQDVSRWFNGNGTSPGYRQRCGIVAADDEPKKDFHSFRHTFIDLMVGKRVDLNLLHKLDGHKLESMTLDRYGKGRSLVPAMLEEVISKADFHLTIPLDHLKASRFARVMLE